MPSLQDVIGSFTPLIRRGSEWEGRCPIEDHPQKLAVQGDTFKCFGCGAEGDALAFLRLVGEPDPEGALSNGRIWAPTLTEPSPRPKPYGLHRIAERPEATVLIVDHRHAAKVAEALLPAYCIHAWPDGGDKWGSLEPLRGRAVLLWPSLDGLADMLKLEAVLVTLGCTGKVVIPDENLTPEWWQNSDTDSLIAWAKPRARPLNPAPQVAQSDSPPRSPEAIAVPSAVNEAGGSPPLPSDPPAVLDLTETLGSDLSDSEPPPPQETDFPPEASLRPPKRRKRHLHAVDGNTALAADPEAEVTPHELSESGIAAHFVLLHRDKFRTVHEWASKQGACWMAWDGSRWRREPSRVTAMQEAQKLAHGVKYWDAAKGVAELSKVKFESRKFIGAFLDLASYAPDFVASPEMFDSDKMMLGTPGGTVDLRCGKLLEPDPAQFITRQTTVTPEKGPHPLFDSVIGRMALGDEAMRAYIWRCLGYSICADQREEIFWFLHGKPQSGKSTLIKTIAEILGNAEDGGYSATFDMELFTEQRNDRGSERLAHLHGARFAWASETEEGKHFKTALLKLATGGDKLSGRFLYQEKFSFEPTHHLWIFGNERIHLKSADAGLKRRIHMIEYPGVISEDERDNTLKERLKAEYPAILHSLVMGCIDWQACGGLGKPEQISDAVERYMDSEDEVGAWIDECVERSPTRSPIGEVFRSFTLWAEKNGAFAVSSKRFAGELEKRGFTRARANGVRYVVGLALKPGANLP